MINGAHRRTRRYAECVALFIYTFPTKRLRVLSIWSPRMHFRNVPSSWWRHCRASDVQETSSLMHSTRSQHFAIERSGSKASNSIKHSGAWYPQLHNWMCNSVLNGCRNKYACLTRSFRNKKMTVFAAEKQPSRPSEKFVSQNPRYYLVVRTKFPGISLLSPH